MHKIVVSLTPVALDRDSRTLKIAHSFAKWGYESIVLEGHPSQKDFSFLGIKIISLERNGINKPVGTNQTPTSYLNALLKLFWNLLKALKLTKILNCVSFYFFKKDFYNKYVNNLNIKIPDADIYYLHSYEYFLAVKEKVIRLGSKVIYDAHDFYLEINPHKPFLGSALIKNFQRKIESDLIKASHLMFTVSEGLSRLYNSAYQTKPMVLRNAHHVEIDDKNCISIRKNLGLTDRDYVTVIIGNCKQGQALGTIISTFLTCLDENYHLAFIGGGYETVQQALTATQQDRVHFLSVVQPTAIVPLARQADFGILPYFSLTDNYKYALPNGFFQMIAAQLPILFSNDLIEIRKQNDMYGFGVSTDFKSTEIFKKDLENFISNFSRKDALRANEALSWKNEERLLKEKTLSLFLM